MTDEHRIKTYKKAVNYAFNEGKKIKAAMFENTVSKSIEAANRVDTLIENMKNIKNLMRSFPR